MTVFTLYGLDVVFPYELMYPEQKEFMEQIKLSLDDGGPCILELPAGSGCQRDPLVRDLIHRLQIKEAAQQLLCRFFLSSHIISKDRGGEVAE